MLTGTGFQWNGVDDYGTYPPSFCLGSRQVRKLAIVMLGCYSGGCTGQMTVLTWMPATHPSTALCMSFMRKGRYVAVGRKARFSPAVMAATGNRCLPVLLPNWLMSTMAIMSWWLVDKVLCLPAPMCLWCGQFAPAIAESIVPPSNTAQSGMAANTVV